MKFTPLTPEKYMQNCLSLIEKGWLPVGSYEKREMKFSRGGKIYDLSAANLEMLDYIEEKGLFIVT